MKAGVLLNNIKQIEIVLINVVYISRNCIKTINYMSRCLTRASSYHYFTSWNGDVASS
jgi:hypothetical protein